VVLAFSAHLLPAQLSGVTAFGYCLVVVVVVVCKIADVQETEHVTQCVVNRWMYLFGSPVMMSVWQYLTLLSGNDLCSVPATDDCQLIIYAHQAVGLDLSTSSLNSRQCNIECCGQWPEVQLLMRYCGRLSPAAGLGSCKTNCC
jgi:hypothetical protein